MQTLQDVIDAALAFPERYGAGAYFLHQGGKIVKAECPLAQEVLSDLIGQDDIVDLRAQSLAAERLECSTEDILAFTRWWDVRGVNWKEVTTRKTLVARGYKVPPPPEESP